MRIGIDVDDTLCPTVDNFLIDFNKKFNKEIKNEDVIDYHFKNFEDIEHDLFYKEIMEHIENKSKDYLPYDDAMENLIKLKRNHELFIVTARFSHIENHTHEWLDRVFGKDFFNEIHFTFKHEKRCKGFVCNKCNIDILIDDAPHHCLNTANEGVKVLMFDRPWNRKIKHDNIIRVHSWAEVVDIIDN